MLNFRFFQFSLDYVRSQSRFHSSNLFLFDYDHEKDENVFQIIPFRKTNLQTGMISTVEIDIGCSFHLYTNKNFTAPAWIITKSAVHHLRY